MLEKITNQIFVEKRMTKMLKLSKISFFLGVIAVIAFPLLSENIKIEEKQLRNTSLFSRKIDSSQFSSYYRSYFNEPNYQDDIFNFCTKIFQNSSQIPYNKIFTRNIISPRGKKFHLIQINLIYDTLKNEENTISTNFVFYSLIKYLSDKNNIRWLAKDIQINYVSKELFDNNPKECYELLTNAKYNERLEQGNVISAIYNFDLSEIDLEKLNSFLIKIVGINSEHVDIDFYRMVVSNFQTNFRDIDIKITTNEPVLSKSVKSNILSVLNSFNDIIKNFEKNKDYVNKYIYIIEDIVNNYFLINNNITTNNLLITNRFNSLLIKTIGASSYNKRDRKVKSYYNLLATVILMIKGMNTEEIDIFRGLYFYILTSPYQCIGYLYLSILVLMTLRSFFHLIELIYHNEYKFIWNKQLLENKKEDDNDNDNVIYASRIISILFFMGIVNIFFTLNIEKIMELIKSKDFVYSYYFLIGNIFVSQIFVLTILRLSKSEEKFINIILMYLNILNCYNFIFINVGIGLTMTVVIMSMEFIFLNLTLIKYCFIKIGIIGLILFGVMNWQNLINSMVGNYIKFNNNVYIIITITVILLSLRLALFIIMIANKYYRGESWEFDEVNDINEIEEEKNEETNKDDNKENNEEINKEEENIIKEKDDEENKDGDIIIEENKEELNNEGDIIIEKVDEELNKEDDNIIKEKNEDLNKEGDIKIEENDEDLNKEGVIIIEEKIEEVNQKDDNVIIEKKEEIKKEDDNIKEDDSDDKNDNIENTYKIEEINIVEEIEENNDEENK